MPCKGLKTDQLTIVDDREAKGGDSVEVDAVASSDKGDPGRQACGDQLKLQQILAGGAESERGLEEEASRRGGRAGRRRKEHLICMNDQCYAHE